MNNDCDDCERIDQNPICSIKAAREQLQRDRLTSVFKAGQTIFYQGNSPIGLYVIQKGLVKLESLSPDGAGNTLRLVGPGEALGYRALFAGDVYRASAIVVEDVTACFISKSVINSMIEQHPSVAFNFLNKLSQDLRLAEDKWVHQVEHDASERVAEALIFLNDHFQGQPWTRQEIAQWAGTTAETVMRTLSQFEKAGWIVAERRRYNILCREKLAEKARGT